MTPENSPATAADLDGEWIVTDHASANCLPPNTWCVRFLMKPGELQWEDAVIVTVSDEGRHLFLQGYRSSGAGISIERLHVVASELDFLKNWQVVEFDRLRPGRPKHRARLSRTRALAEGN